MDAVKCAALKPPPPTPHTLNNPTLCPLGAVRRVCTSVCMDYMSQASRFALTHGICGAWSASAYLLLAPTPPVHVSFQRHKQHRIRQHLRAPLCSHPEHAAAHRGPDEAGGGVGRLVCHRSHGVHRERCTHLPVDHVATTVHVLLPASPAFLPSPVHPAFAQS